MKMIHLSIGLLVPIALLGSVMPLVIQKQAIAQASAVTKIPSKNESTSPVEQLLVVGKQQYRQADFKSAIATYQQALALGQKTNDRTTQIDALLQLGDMDLWIGQVSAAESKVQQALKLARESSDRKREGRVLASVASVQRYRQAFDKALDTLKTALAINQQARDTQGEVRSRLLAGIMLYSKKQYPQALEGFQQALKVAQADNNQDEIAHLYDWMAITYRDLQGFKQAEAMSLQQQALSRSIGYKLAEYDGLSTTVNLAQEQKQPDRVLQARQQQLAIAQSVNNPWFQRDALINIGFIYVNQKQFDKGLGFYQEALVVAKTIDEPAVADIVNRMGVVYGRSEQYPQALEAYQQALKIYLKSNQKSDIAQVFSNIGHNYKQQKLYPESREAYQQAFARYEALGNQTKQSETLSEIGYIYLSQSNVILNQQKDYIQARKLAEQGTAVFEKQRVIAEKLSDRTQLFYALIGIGQSYDKQASAVYRAGQYSKSLPLDLQALSFKQEALKLAEEMKNAALIGTAQYAIEASHFGLINTYDDIGQPEMALEHLEKARKIVQILKKTESEERLLNSELTLYLGIANSYTNPIQNAQKLKAIEKIIALSRQLNQPNTELVYLNMTAQIYYFWGQHDRAWDTYQQVLKLAQSTKSPQMEILALLGMGQVLQARADYPKALMLNQKALEVVQSNKPLPGEIPSLNNISNIYNLTGQYPKALDFNQKARTIIQSQYDIYSKGVTVESIRLQCLESENFGDKNPDREKPKSGLSAVCNEPIVIPTGSTFDLMKGVIASSAKSLRTSTATNFSNLGSIYGDQGDYLKSIELYQKALEISRELKDTKSEALNLNNIASTYSNQGSYSLAFPLAEQAVAMSVEQKNQTNEVTYRSNLAAIHASWGNYPKALENYQQVLALAKQLKTPGPKAVALRAIGNIYNYQGQYIQAIEFLQKGLAIDQEIGNPTGTIMAEAALSRVYLKLGQSGKALELGQKSLARSQAIGAGAYEIEALQNLADIYVDQGDFKSAQTSFQKALELANKSEAIESKALILFGMANINLRQNQPKQSLDLFQQALSLQQKIGVKRAAAQTLNRIGQAQTQLNNPEANNSLQSAIVLAREIGDVPTQAQTQAHLGQLYTQQNKPAAAIVFYKQSIQHYEAIRKGLVPLPPAQQQSYTNTISDTYRALADLLITQNRLGEAEQILSLLKLQEIKDYAPPTRSTAQNTEVLLSTQEQAIAAQYNTLIALGQKLQACDSQNSPACTQLQSEQQKYTEAFNNFLDQLIPKVQEACTQYAEKNCLLPNDNFTSGASKLVQAQPGTLVISLFVVKDKVWILVASEGGIITRYRSNIDRITLGTKIIEFRQLLKSPYSDLNDLKSTSKQLYDWLILPILPALNASNRPKNLIFALDRSTRYLPMGALFDGQQYLTQRYTISTVLSPENTQTQPTTLGNVDDSTVLALGLSEGSQDGDFSALPNVVAEVNSIVRQSGIYPGQKFLNRDFTLAAINQNIKGKKVLHLATHGKFVSSRQNESFLILGDKTKLPIESIRGINGQNGFNGVELVVLSACESALGDPEQEGVEIPGLSSYFLNKGAGAVMASLWAVDDGSTALSMQQFYQNLATGKMTKAEAIQKVQQDLIQSKLTSKDVPRGSVALEPVLGSGSPRNTDPPTTFAHPYYWAPFILIGNSL